jgi:hypothetical protein
MIDVGSVVGVVDWAATSYVESGLEAAREIITNFKLHKRYLSFMFRTLILVTINNKELVVYG